ncbi:mediator complex subunit 23-domain-containing protein [Umbelopsis sp. AD052]|nr:mediator complex subunit 23-domain-containing protein [Umbelopsis sp. AD052]
MEALRTVIARLFSDIQDVPTEDVDPADKLGNSYYGLFNSNPAKRQRLHLLHPTGGAHGLKYQSGLISSRSEYAILASEFVRACQTGSMAEQLKILMIKYREPPLTVVKTSHLLTFLHHLLILVPITSTPNVPNFPLSQLFEDLGMTLTLRPTQQFPFAYQIWIMNLQFMLSCIKEVAPQALYNAGITTPVVLGIIKHLLLELTRLPIEVNSIQQKCFDMGKELLDTFLLKDTQSERSSASTGSKPAVIPKVSYYDIIFSFPELYGHFLHGSMMPIRNETAPSAYPQPSIVNYRIWQATLQYMIASIRQDVKLLDRIPTLMAINIIKHVLREINTLPADLSKSESRCLNSGKELINLLLLGPHGDGAGVVSHYDIIVALPDVYGHFLRGTFAQSVHWTMEKFINELGKRRRHLAFLMMPPDASWPLISQMSRRHEYNDLTTRTSYHMFEGDLIEFVKEGNSTGIETHFRDMLFQRASMDEFRQLTKSLTITGLDTSQVRKAMITKIRDVIRCIQQNSNFERRQESSKEREPYNPATNVRGEDITMLIPDNIDLWELMMETADQLYSFVTAEFFTYEDILQDFYDLVYQYDGKPYPIGTKHQMMKDNSLIWLLLQLFHIEKIGSSVIQKDFEGDERLFDKLIRLYNEEQILTKGAFSLRDLALQCAINHQQVNIKDRTNIKQRHPRVTAALQYAGLCYQVQAYFSNHYYSKATDPTVFCNLSMQEVMKVAMESQLRQNLVANTLYVYLVPNKVEIGTLGYPKATFLKGGTLGYKLLDFLNVSAKHRLLQLIYKMMLDTEAGPRYQAASSSNITCVSPHVLDVVYKLLYSAPCSAELMIKEIFDKLRRCDKLIKTRYESKPEAESLLPDHTVRWLHTILQLLNHRFLRFLKHSSLSSGLLHYIRYSLSYLDHRQVYQVLESFAVNIMRMQSDAKVLRSLDDPNREKPIWFAESEMLARTMVSSIVRLIKTRGQADIRTEQIHRVLSNLYEYRIEWSEETLKFFPPAVRSFYTDPHSNNHNIPLRPQVTYAKIQQMIQTNKAYMAFLLQGSNEKERAIKHFFSILENQSSLLPMIWTLALMRMSTDVFHMPSVRKAMLCIPASRIATHTIDLVDFILSKEAPQGDIQVNYSCLDAMIWKHQWVSFTHVVFALVKGSGNAERSEKAFQYLEYLLLESPEFSRRVETFTSLQFSSKYWAEDNHHEKLMTYLAQFPEYSEFESYGMKDFEQTQHMDPPTSPPMPIYFTNVVLRFIPFFDVIINRLIEYEQPDLLARILDKHGHLFQYHHYPLSFICNLFLDHYSSPTLHEPYIKKRLLRLLDFTQYEFLPEAITYATDEMVGAEIFGARYFELVFHKLADNLSPQKCAPKATPNLPERHFREIGSPAVQGIHVALLEVLLTPTPPETVCKYILDLALFRGDRHIGVQALTIHAIGLLISALPIEEYLQPIWDELMSLITGDQYLTEISEPCRLIRCGIPQNLDSESVQPQPLSDVTNTAILKNSISVRLSKAMVFPYIFNDYTFNVHNYSTNAANSFLTLFHSVLHYSSLDIFDHLLDFLRRLRKDHSLKTDVQLLYICAMLGPILHRTEKLNNTDAVHTDADILIELMHMVKQVSIRMDMKDGWTTQAQEQVFDFLHHIRAQFVKSPELAAQISDIIKSMNAPIAQRLSRLVM